MSTAEEPQAKRAKTEESTGEAPSIQRRSDGKKYVGKGSLVEAELIKAKEEARSKNPEDMTPDEKKEERRIANRLSAFQSRQRRKAIIEDLHKTVAEISKENADHRKNNAVLQAQLDVVQQENTLLRQQFAVMAAAQASKPAAAAASGEGEEKDKDEKDENGDSKKAAAAPANAMSNNVMLALLGAQLMGQQNQQQGEDGQPAQPPDVFGMLGRLLQPPAAAAPAAKPAEETMASSEEKADENAVGESADV